MRLQVLMKDIVTPVPPEEVRGMIKKSLETAALVNYERLSKEAKIDGVNQVVKIVLLSEIFVCSRNTSRADSIKW